MADPELLTDREHGVLQMFFADGWSLRRIARFIAGFDRPRTAEERRYLHALEVEVWRDYKRACAVLQSRCESEDGPFDLSFVTSLLNTVEGE